MTSHTKWVCGLVVNMWMQKLAQTLSQRSYEFDDLTPLLLIVLTTTLLVNSMFHSILEADSTDYPLTMFLLLCCALDDMHVCMSIPGYRTSGVSSGASWCWYGFSGGCAFPHTLVCSPTFKEHGQIQWPVIQCALTMIRHKDVWVLTPHLGLHWTCFCLAGSEYHICFYLDQLQA